MIEVEDRFDPDSIRIGAQKVCPFVGPVVRVFGPLEQLVEPAPRVRVVVGAARALLVGAPEVFPHVVMAEVGGLVVVPLQGRQQVRVAGAEQAGAGKYGTLPGK